MSEKMPGKMPNLFPTEEQIKHKKKSRQEAIKKIGKRSGIAALFALSTLFGKAQDNKMSQGVGEAYQKTEVGQKKTYGVMDADGKTVHILEAKKKRNKTVFKDGGVVEMAGSGGVIKDDGNPGGGPQQQGGLKLKPGFKMINGGVYYEDGTPYHNEKGDPFIRGGNPNSKPQQQGGLKLKPGFKIMNGGVYYEDGRPYHNEKGDPFIRDGKNSDNNPQEQKGEEIQIDGKRYLKYTHGSEKPIDSNGNLKPNYKYQDGNYYKEVN